MELKVADTWEELYADTRKTMVWVFEVVGSSEELVVLTVNLDASEGPNAWRTAFYTGTFPTPVKPRNEVKGNFYGAFGRRGAQLLVVDTANGNEVFFDTTAFGRQPKTYLWCDGRELQLLPEGTYLPLGINDEGLVVIRDAAS